MADVTPPTDRPRSSPRRILWGLLVAAVAVLVPAAPAAADPPGPTDYRSEVTSVSPDVDGVEVSIVGGDGFLLLEVAEGITVEVPGYAGEPYVRFLPDGTVQENQESAATYLNQGRTRSNPDREYDPEAEPVWRTVATDGRWAWHDHRIHFMGGGDPPAGVRTATGVEWEVPIVVDGEEVTIEGTYRLLDAPSPWPWVALSAAIVVVALVVGARWVSPVTVAGALVLLGGIGGVVAGVAQRGASPPGAPTSPLVVILPAIAAVAGTIAVLQRGRVLRAVAALAGAAALGAWAAFRLPVLWSAILPTSLAAPTDRALTAAALGAAVAAAILVVRSGALAPDLHDDPAPDPAGDAPAAPV